MQNIAPVGKGKMVALVGMEKEEVLKIIEDTKELEHMPFDTIFLLETGNKLKQELEKIEVKNPQMSYVDEDFINTMLNKGVDTFIEIEPQSVLADFNKRFREKKGIKVRCFNVEDLKTLEELLHNLDKQKG
jgi:malonyl CoA-acyl carrier protein transacylase